MSFKRHKQSALPNKNYPLNANTKYNWSLRSFDWLIFERHSLPEFILVGIYETFLQLTRYHCTPTIFTAWQDFLNFSHTDRFSNQSQFTFHFFPNDLFPLCQGLETSIFFGSYPILSCIFDNGVHILVPSKHYKFSLAISRDLHKLAT